MASMIDPASALQSPVGAEHPTLLIVDDSRLMRHALKKILSPDFNLVEAVDGEDAWEKLQSEPDIQAIFSDLSMPNLDGYGLLERVRKSTEARINNLPFIVITGKEGDDTSLRTEAQALGANEIVCKPFKSEEIISMTNRFLAAGEEGGAETEVQRLVEEAEAQSLAEETARVTAEAEARRIAAEAEAQRQAEESARHAAEAETHRIAAEVEAQRQAEEAARVAAEQEARRITEESEAQRLAEENARFAIEQEARRIATEAEAQRQAEESARLAAEADAQRMAEEAKAQRLAEETARVTAEAEARRIAAEAEAQRQAEESARHAAEAETHRIAAEVEAQRQAEEAARVAAEQEARRIIEESEAQRLAEETARVAAEADAQRAAETAPQQPVQEELFAGEALEEVQLAAEDTAVQAANDTEPDYTDAAVAEAAGYTELRDTDDDLFNTAADEPQRFPLLTRTCIRLAMPAMRLVNYLLRLNKDKQLAALRERL